MDLKKLKRGELIAAIGGLVLLFSLLFLNWYGVTVSAGAAFGGISGEFKVGVDLGAWDAQGPVGTLANLVILAAGVFAVGLAVVTATSRTVALPIATSAVTTALGAAALVMVLGRMILQPGPNEIVDLKFGIFLALAATIAITYGGWRSMQEEGTSLQEAREQLEGHLKEGPARAGPPSEPPSEAPPSHE